MQLLERNDTDLVTECVLHQPVCYRFLRSILAHPAMRPVQAAAASIKLWNGSAPEPSLQRRAAAAQEFLTQQAQQTAQAATAVSTPRTPGATPFLDQLSNDLFISQSLSATRSITALSPGPEASALHTLPGRLSEEMQGGYSAASSGTAHEGPDQLSCLGREEALQIVALLSRCASNNKSSSTITACKPPLSFACRQTVPSCEMQCNIRHTCSPCNECMQAGPGAGLQRPPLQDSVAGCVICCIAASCDAATEL